MTIHRRNAQTGETEIINEDAPSFAGALTKRPLSRWSFRLAMKPYETLVEQIIDGVQDAALREAIRAKWDHGHTFHFSHDDTQMMLGEILKADPTFDADAVWAVGEAAEYPA
jgi:hypothetical protein